MTDELADDIERWQGSIVDLGPECFASGDLSVISWKGENYYRACGEVVTTLETGGYSHCVKRRKHPGKVHEDYFGYTKDCS